LEKNRQKVQLKGCEIFGKKVLILGEAGSGKTMLAAQLIQELMDLVNPEKISVIDLAPKRVGEFGGKLTDYLSISGKVKYYSPKRVYTPRLSGKSPKQILRYAELNKRNMQPLFNEFIRNATDILVINDITLYLHSGELETILECVKLAKTFLATAYYGSKLAEDLGTGISLRERRLTDRLAAFMDLVVKID
jgi:GTPase SAR1 family protein